jgi:hypothetical protein
LRDSLEEHRFEIEHKAFLKRSRNETDESEELIVLVARKCVQVYTETLNSSVKAKQKQKEIS